MTVNGVLSIPKTMASPSTGKECTLLDILEEEVDEKYFLSAEQTRRLLKDSWTDNRESGSTAPQGHLSP